MDEQSQRPVVSLATIIGLTLLLGPLTTLAHEIGGHAATCAALGGHIAEIGAYYVECTGTGDTARRLVAMAGTGVDAVLFALFFLLWKRSRSDLGRLVLWMLFTVKGMEAAGYWLFSGVVGIGDWSPGDEGGIGPLPNEYLWRILLAAAGLAAYIFVVRLGIRTLRSMIGGGAEALVAQKRIALGFYVVNGALAILIGIFNPHGLFITLASAAASSLGGTAGMFNIAYARSSEPGRPFLVRTSLPLILLGLAAAAGFGLVLGPTLYFPS